MGSWALPLMAYAWADEEPRCPGDNEGARPGAAVVRGWNRGRIRRVLTESPMNPGECPCIRAIAAVSGWNALTSGSPKVVPRTAAPADLRDGP